MITLTLAILFIAISVFLSYRVKKSARISSFNGMRNKPPHYTQWVWSLFYDDKDKSRSPDSGDIIYFAFKHLFRLWSCLSIVWYAPLMLLALTADYASLYVVFPRLPREYDATKDWRGSLSPMELAASRSDPEGSHESEVTTT